MIQKYVILINDICGMGGGQMYARNKTMYMKSLGWDPYVFFGIDGPIVITELKTYKQGYYPLLAASPLVYNKQKVEQVLSYLQEMIGTCDQLVIESSSPHMALWGELLAQTMKGKHMAHLLDERCDQLVPEEYLPFYQFKHERRELSGIHVDSLKLLFRGKVEMNDNNAYYLPTVCTNTVSEETVDDQFDLPDKDNRIVLGCIGRIEKAYVFAAANAFSKVIQKYPESLFRVIFIGAPQNSEIQNLFQNMPNVDVVMMGYVYPIPYSLLDYVDIFMSSAGSAHLTYGYGKITISIDGVDSKAIGVLGYTTQHALYRKEEPQIEPDQLLEAVLFADYLKNYSYVERPKQLDVEEKLKKHIVFLEESEKVADYYPIMEMRPAGKDKKKRLIVNMIGAKHYLLIRPILNKWQNMARKAAWFK